MNKLCLSIFIFLLINFSIRSQDHSVARQWNEVVLEAIRNDFARPTVHARNLFHVSAAIYDAWAIFNSKSATYLVGRDLNGFISPFDGFEIQFGTIGENTERAINYASFRLIEHRFRLSPLYDSTKIIIDGLVSELNIDPSFISTDYSQGSAAALGNYIASEYIRYGLQDGSNEDIDYQNLFYTVSNDPLLPEEPGNPNISDPNRWQPLTLELFIDQAGNEIPGATPDFLSPEWGLVSPFALTQDDLTIYERGGNEYWVYHDPEDPPYLREDGSGLSSEYQWGFTLVPIWQSHLDPTDGVMWDISPGASGNIGTIDNYPTEITDFRDFYNELDGGDPGTGRSINPSTGEPYPPNLVPRGDYARVLAEFWADGPDSETPPGHWFTILNKVNDHPDLQKRFKGEGEVLPDLEWDVKSYFTLGGAMHDCAISAWGVKGWYDYIRPISAVRFMADQGQSSDPNLPNYAANGIPLTASFVELVEEGDPLAGDNNENVNKIKLYTWRGPDFISEPETDVAGVGWILAENWWPFQRPSFITPNFAGYVSGHSTYSRAAAEVLTLFTGDEYFPGGVGEFFAPQNEFLVFEEGPSVDITLQWATYRDASDQTSLSRIWGGIHPPADDIPGRIMGDAIAIDAFNLAESYFNQLVTSTNNEGFASAQISVFPNPATNSINILSTENAPIQQINLIDIQGRKIIEINNSAPTIDVSNTPPGTYVLQIFSENGVRNKKVIITK